MNSFLQENNKRDLLLAVEAGAEGVEAVVRQALGERAREVHVSESGGGCRVGIEVHPNPAVAFAAMTMGPDVSEGTAAVKKESKDFRSFWGVRSELRRFDSGLIAETMTWTHTGMPLLCEIVAFALQRHLNVPVDKVTTVGLYDDEKAWRQVGITPIDLDTVRSQFRTLQTHLQELQSQLSITIRLVHGVDWALRGCVPLRPAMPLSVVLELESHSQWPDHLVAIERIKIAVLLRISALLREKKWIREASPTDTFVDITYPNGISFRLRALYPRELPLRLAERDTAGFSKTQAEAANSAAIHALERHVDGPLPLLPMINKVASDHHSFSNAVRLVHRWMQTHGVAHYLTPEAIQLLVARCFTQPDPYATAPSSATQALYRTLLLLDRYAFDKMPLFVPFGDTASLTASQRQEAMKARAASTQPLFIVTPLDTTRSLWTETQLNRGVWNAVRSMARHSLALMDSMDKGQIASWTFIMATPVKGMQAFVSLAKYTQHKVGFEPVSYLVRDLRQLLGSSLQGLFYDDLYPTVMSIAVKDPPARWKQDIKLLGKGYVLDVYTNASACFAAVNKI